MKKIPFKSLIEVIHLEVFFNPNTSTIDYNLRINNDYSIDELDCLLTKKICLLGDKSRQLESDSKRLMDIRSMIKK